uniref:Putative secreted peptide n=1 Tax=Anopheles braziliensis TaxID=58242 RepID=A0A2M3ZPV6_9DIPT
MLLTGPLPATCFLACRLAAAAVDALLLATSSSSSFLQQLLLLLMLLLLGDRFFVGQYDRQVGGTVRFHSARTGTARCG